MRAGQLRHRITVQQNTANAETPAADGTVTAVWAALYANISAEVIQVAGGEVLRGGIQVQATTTHAIRLRYRGDISPEMRIVWGALTLHVTRVWDADGRTRETLLEAEAAN
jgi:head-tail adaptor